MPKRVICKRIVQYGDSILMHGFLGLVLCTWHATMEMMVLHGDGNMGLKVSHVFFNKKPRWVRSLVRCDKAQVGFIYLKDMCGVFDTGSGFI